MLNIPSHKRNTIQNHVKDYIYILLEWQLSRTQTTNVGEDVGKNALPYTCSGNVN
jgi:hypothetical protein